MTKFDKDFLPTSHVDYKVFDLEKYGIKSEVKFSNTSESVYVNYYKDGKGITCRFSTHANNAVKDGSMLNGRTVWFEEEILYYFGLAEELKKPVMRKAMIRGKETNAPCWHVLK